MSKTELGPQCFSLQELLVLSFFILSLGDSLKSYSFLRQGQNTDRRCCHLQPDLDTYTSAQPHTCTHKHTPLLLRYGSDYA